MKKLNQIVIGLLFFAIIGCRMVEAQDDFSNIDLSGLSENGVLQLSGTNISSFQTFSDDELNALVDVLDATPTVSMSSLPTNRWGSVIGGTFWSLQNPGMPPLPSDTMGIDVWPMADGSFLLQDLDADYSGGSSRFMGMRAMDDGSPFFPGGDVGTNYDWPTNTYVAPDYGTNLWIALTNVAADFISGFVSNTTGNMQIEIQFTTDLAFLPWQSAGWFVYGSQTTNWTAWVEPTISSSNLFLRAVAYTDDGSGLPVSWQLEYFGTTGVDPNGDPMGDGWSNIQKFNNGMNPNVFYTPEPPLLAVSANVFSGIATVSWKPILKGATNYTVKRFDVEDSFYFATNTFSVNGATFSLQDNVPLGFAEPWYFNPSDTAVHSYYQIQAHYAAGDSSWSAPVYLKPDADATVSLVNGIDGFCYLAVASLPAGTEILRVSRIDLEAESFGDYSFDVTNDILVSSASNGIYQIPKSVTDSPVDSYGVAYYDWYLTVVDGNGETVGDPIFLSPGFADELTDQVQNWIVPPFLDGRQQLKQNLTFLLRAATKDAPFEFTDRYGYENFVSFTNQNRFVVADCNPRNNSGYYVEAGNNKVDPLVPFVENALFRNFILSSDDAGGGHITSGVSGNYESFYLTPLLLTNPALYNFNLDMITGTTGPSFLSTSSSYWLASYPLDSPNLGQDANGDWVAPYLGEIGVAGTLDNSFNLYYSMPGTVSNYWGLRFVSATIAYDNGSGGVDTTVLDAGSTLENVDGYFYPQTAQPIFQTIEYDFWNGRWPESPGFATTNVSDFMATPVGGSIAVNGYAKLALQNGYPGVYAYLGQYFTNAFQIDTNGNPTATQTDVLSPYGNFFATMPGPVALVTMPDVDTGQQGTCTVFCVSLAVDKNHDSIIDLAFNGQDNTSLVSPDQVWVNDNYDRGHTVDSSDFEQDDLGEKQIESLPAYQRVPDFNYVNSVGQPCIPCTRDLEDYFRLWTPGLASAMKKMPAGYSVRLTLTAPAECAFSKRLNQTGARTIFSTKQSLRTKSITPYRFMLVF